MEAGRICWAATRRHSDGDARQPEARARVQRPPQHEGQEPGEHAQQGQAHATIEVVVLVGRRLTVARLLWRCSAVNVTWVSVAAPCGDDRHGRHDASPVRKLVAGQPMHREDREEHREKGPQRVDT